jgi:membrane protease YdiL (CAAX protease family)
MSNSMKPHHRPDPAEFIQDALPADATQNDFDTSRTGPAAPAWPTLIAWLLILAVATLVIVRTVLRKNDATAAMVDSVVTMQMQGRYLVGAASLGLSGSDGKLLFEQARNQLDRGSYSQRLRFAILAGELVGPDEALEILEQLEADRRAGTLEAREVSTEAADKLLKLYEGYRKNSGKPILSPEDQQWLRSRLGWFGQLALAPSDGDRETRQQALAPARRTLVVYFSAIGLGLLGLVAGGFLLLLLVLLAFLGRLRGGLQCGTARGGVYAETFAAYMLLFVGLSYASRFVPIPPRFSMAFSGLIAFASLLALYWPRLRGVSWQQVREGVGLNLGGQPLLAIICGPACYLCALPLLLGGVLITVALMFAQRHFGYGDPFRPGAGPSHPILGQALGSDAWTWLQVFLVACVAAPIVEEIMFRGVLYRHLREASWRWGGFLSISFSALASSFVFAAIHPQGWLGIPVLMALAIAFALAREWRRSLVPAMIAHGMNNGISLLLLILAAA